MKTHNLYVARYKFSFVIMTAESLVSAEYAINKFTGKKWYTRVLVGTWKRASAYDDYGGVESSNITLTKKDFDEIRCLLKESLYNAAVV